MGTIPKFEDCNPGFDPVEYNVVIAPETFDEKIGSIIIPDRQKDMENMATVRGLLVAASPLAFNFDDWPDSEAHRRPKPGDHVIYAKFGGILLKGDDGREYRLLKDKDVSAVIRDPEVSVEVVRRAA